MPLYDASYNPGNTMSLKENVPSSDIRPNYLEASNSLYLNETQQYGSNDNQSDVGSHDYLDSNILSHENPASIRGSGQSCVSLISKVFQTGKRLFNHQRQCVQTHEGPFLIRMLCFVGGLLMVLCSLLSMLNLKALLRGPFGYVLQLYQGFFGIIIMIIEVKDWDCLDQFKPWANQWFRFLTVPAGRGAFYLFVGSLGVSLMPRNFLKVALGLYMGTMAIVSIAVHSGSRASPFASNLATTDDYSSELLGPSYEYNGEPLTAGLPTQPRQPSGFAQNNVTGISLEDPNYGRRSKPNEYRAHHMRLEGAKKQPVSINGGTVPHGHRTTSTASSSSSLHKF